MKKKLLLFVLFSLVFVPLCLGISACSRNTDPDKLEAKTTLTYTYGDSIDVEDFDVKLVHPNGEKEQLHLKSATNAKGFTYDTINSSASDPALDVVHPTAGIYTIIIKYKNLETYTLVTVNKASFPDTTTLSTQASIKYITEKPNLELNGLTVKADTIKYYFSKLNTESGEWESHIEGLSKEAVENCDESEFFINNRFGVGTYKVYATVEASNYVKYTTNEVEFNVTKASLSGKYYVDVRNVTFEYNPNATTLAGYYLNLTIAKDNRYDGQNLEINGSFAWKTPTTEIEITDDEGELQTVVFSSKNFTLFDDGDEFDISVRFQKRHFPYLNIALFLDDEMVRDFSYYDLQDSYDFTLKVSNTLDQTYIDIPSPFTYELLDSNNQTIVDNHFVPSQSDIDNGYFIIKYIIPETEHYVGKSGQITINLNQQPDPGV